MRFLHFAYDKDIYKFALGKTLYITFFRGKAFIMLSKCDFNCGLLLLEFMYESFLEIKLLLIIYHPIIHSDLLVIKCMKFQRSLLTLWY